MERHDPLSTTLSADQAAPPAPVAPKKSRRQPLLLRELADVKDETLAFLYSGPEQRPGDYERNFDRAAEIREAFLQFCTANPYFSNWRQAWAAFFARQQMQTSSASNVSLQAPALPRWKARFVQAARS
jgi:hypothetical protein